MRQYELSVKYSDDNKYVAFVVRKATGNYPGEGPMYRTEGYVIETAELKRLVGFLGEGE